jgi:hypothetical protein
MKGKEGTWNIIRFAPFGSKAPEVVLRSKLVRYVFIPPLIWSCRLDTRPFGRADIVYISKEIEFPGKICIDLARRMASRIRKFIHTASIFLVIFNL